MLLHAAEDVGQVVVGVDAPGLAGGHERVDAREALSGLDVADEEVVLAPERDATERTLRGVVVERHAGIIEEDAELIPLRECVADGCRERALRRVPRRLRIEPRPQLLADGTAAFSPEFEVGFGRQVLLLGGVLDGVELADEVNGLLGNGAVLMASKKYRRTCAKQAARRRPETSSTPL